MYIGPTKDLIELYTNCYIGNTNNKLIIYKEEQNEDINPSTICGRCYILNENLSTLIGGYKYCKQNKIIILIKIDNTYANIKLNNLIYVYIYI